MRSLLKRPTLAFVMASVWIGWAIWANVPHFYDAQAMHEEIAAVVGRANVEMQPAATGFPFTYMRYDYSNSNQLTIHDTELSALLPNILFSLAGTFGITLLVARMRHLSFLGIAISLCLILPAAFMNFYLNGWHPAVITYLYLVPLMLLLMSLAVETIQERRRQNHRMHGSGGGERVLKSVSTPAAP